MSEPVDLIANALATQLVHPGDDKTKPFTIPLPVFRTSAIPPELAQEFAQAAGLPHPDLARLTAEAIVQLLTDNELTITPAAEIKQLRDAAASTETHRHKAIQLYCTCGEKLLTANISDYGTDKPRVNGPGLINAARQLNPDCSVKHQATA